VFERVVVSCEHGGNEVPEGYRSLFRDDVLESHRGWDPGALRIAKRLARAWGAPLHYATTTRLLVDLNRTRGRFSAYTRHLPRSEKRKILDAYYDPYWNGIEDELMRGPFPVLHVSVHTFTPVLAGVERNADFAILYDPKRKREKRTADEWLAEVRQECPHLRLRRNYPYRGTADGLTTAMRRIFPDKKYAGLELEFAQLRRNRSLVAILEGLF